MKTLLRRSTRFASLLLLSLAAFSQGGPSPTGAYAFLATAKQADSFGESGGAILAVINFDGGGNISGTSVLKARTGDPQEGDTGSSPVTGTYTTNPDGSGNVTLDFTEFGFTAKLAMVITNGGKTIQFADGPGSTGPLSLNPSLPGTPERFAGALSATFFLQNSLPGAQAIGTIPITLTRTYNDVLAVYSLAAPTTATGAVTCPDGTAGTWSAIIPSTSVSMWDTSGNFLMPVRISACDRQDTFNYSGLANLNSSPAGANLVLHLTGFFVVGSARATSGVGPSGTYGVQTVGEPFPNAGLQLLTFDGAGKITASFINTGATNAFTGTYTTNPDGSGTITMTATANPSATPVTFAYATAADGATIYTLRTSGGNAGGDVITGVGHLQ